MEFYPVVQGKRLPEVYHFGFNGTHFEIFLNPTYWFKFLEFTGKGTPYALSQGADYVAPSVLDEAFGQHGLARVSHTLEGSARIEIPAFIEKSDGENQAVTMRDLGHTLSSILYALENLLYDVGERNEKAEQHGYSQLFVLETFVARDPGQRFHGAGLGLSLSPIARRYLEGLGNDVALGEVVEAMEEHYQKLHPSGKKIKLFRGAIRVRLRQHGVLGMHTVGDCACLGAMPENFGDNRGCYLHSHNVDTVAQQFNILVGIAHVWQMVRNGIRMEPQTS